MKYLIGSTASLQTRTTPQLYMRAQIVIQAAFFAFGDREAKTGVATLKIEDLINTLGFATGALLAAKETLATEGEIVGEAENIGNYIAACAQLFRETGDTCCAPASWLQP